MKGTGVPTEALPTKGTDPTWFARFT
jgi:hypothetical protein